MLCRSIFFTLPVINKSRKSLFWYPRATFYTSFGVEYVSIEKVIALYMSAKLPKLHHHIFCFVFFCQQRYLMYRPLQIQYSQIAKAALRFIILWSSLNKGPKFIPSAKALLSLNFEVGCTFWEPCEINWLKTSHLEQANVQDIRSLSVPAVCNLARLSSFQTSLSAPLYISAIHSTSGTVFREKCS